MMKSHISLRYIAWLGGFSLLARLHSKAAARSYVTSLQGARNASMSERILGLDTESGKHP